MCDRPTTKQHDILRPEYALASLIQGEMQMGPIDPIALRLFIRLHWTEVSRLAHKIHGSGPDTGCPQ